MDSPLAQPHHRASSYPDAPPPWPLDVKQNGGTTPARPPSSSNDPRASSAHRSRPSSSSSSAVAATTAAAAAAQRNGRAVVTPPKPTLLQPRVAVVLNVPRPWHKWLFALRLASILPAIYWGLPSALRLLLRLLPRPEGTVGVVTAMGERYPWTETFLATIWCFASGYLSFFFTDCLMSRWLLHYTPQATLVRLLSINAVNAYVTSTVIHLAGGGSQPRLLLPAWIMIATTLTVCYHIVHAKINIRKETSTSVNVFSIASYLSMLALLMHLHLYSPNYPEMPFMAQGRQLTQEVVRLADQLQGLQGLDNEL